jgi:Cu-processing system permease protein
MAPASSWSALLLCARQERALAVRSRWTQIFAVLFAILSLAVAASGYILSGGSGIQDFARTSVSLVQLVLLLVPVTSLVMGVLSLAPERGAAELIYSQPVSRHVVFVGKMVGLFEALVGAELIGFGLAGTLIFYSNGADGLPAFLLIIAGAAAITAVFLALSAAIAAGYTAARRTRALAIAIVIWFFTAIVFDLALLGTASLLRSGDATRLLILGVLINPIDAARTAMLLGIEGTGAFGTAALAFLRFTHGPTAAAVVLPLTLVGWIGALVAVATRRLSNADF